MTQGAFPEEDLQQPLSPWRHFFTNGLTGLAIALSAIAILLYSLSSFKLSKKVYPDSIGKFSPLYPPQLAPIPVFPTVSLMRSWGL